jgi:hypothetical protein
VHLARDAEHTALARQVKFELAGLQQPDVAVLFPGAVPRRLPRTASNRPETTEGTVIDGPLEVRSGSYGPLD